MSHTSKTEETVYEAAGGHDGLLRLASDRHRTMKRASVAPAVGASLALCGCVDPGNVTAETLGLAVADAGFPCENVASASELGAGSWRVACGGGHAYVATVLVTGDICVEPLPIGDFTLGLGGGRQRDRSPPNDPGVVTPPLDRCAPNVKLR